MFLKKIPLLIIIFSLVLLFASSDLLGQILNIERYRLERQQEKSFIMNTTLGLSVNNRSAAEDSPVNLFGYNGRINTIYFSDQHTYTGIAQVDYLKINDNPFLNFGFLHFRAHFFSDNNSSVEIFSQVSYDNFRGLDPRILGGVGFRQKVIDSNRSLVYFGTGILYEWETWKHPEDKHLIQSNLIKSTNYLSYRLSVNEFLDFNTIVYYQVGYDKNIDNIRNRLSGNFNLNSKISERFSITNTFDFSYENRPIVPITRFIFNFRTGLSFAF